MCVATVATTTDSDTGDGRSDGTTSLLRPMKKVPRDSPSGAMRLVTGVAHASAIPVSAEEGGDGMSAELPEGEKPELIKQADAEVSVRVFRCGRTTVDVWHVQCIKRKPTRWAAMITMMDSCARRMREKS